MTRIKYTDAVNKWCEDTDIDIAGKEIVNVVRGAGFVHGRVLIGGVYKQVTLQPEDIEEVKEETK
jgi:hypothetical protein